MEIKNQQILSALILGLSVVAATAVGADSFYRSKQLSNVLSVTGSAEKTVVSDTVKWQSSITRSVDAAQLKEGSAQIKSDIETIQAYFKSSGVPDAEITINPVTITPFCQSQNGISYDKFGNQSCGSSPTAGYNLQQVITIESGRVDEIAKLTQNASDYFVGKGLVFTTQSLEYYYSKLADLRLDLLTEATKDAKDRAQKIAESTGKKIDSLQTASQGVFQVTAKNSVEVSDYGAYDTASLEKR